ncbi:MAG TPA: hypothetical protein VGS41_19350 [Chthonomonadales bacterium]|nr:hypothetical protein [Chthonomonadales bacterium]
MTYPLMSVVLLLRASAVEKGTSHALKIILVDQDGKAVVATPPMSFQVPNAPGTQVEMNVVANIGGVAFQRYGDYRADVTIDDSSVSEFPIRVQPPPQIAAQPPQQSQG